MINLLDLIEIVLVFVVIYYFYKWERPRKRFLFYGLLFAVITFVIKIPVILVNVFLSGVENYFSFSEVFIQELIVFSVLFSIVITEVARYFSLRRYLRTKSYKNGILFGMGWGLFDSIYVFQLVVVRYLSDLSLRLDFGTLSLVPEVVQIVPVFSFLPVFGIFILNIAQTTLMVIGVIKKEKVYIVYAILLGVVVYLKSLNDVFGLLGDLVLLIICLVIIFNYRKIK